MLHTYLCQYSPNPAKSDAVWPQLFLKVFKFNPNLITSANNRKTAHFQNFRCLCKFSLGCNAVGKDKDEVCQQLKWGTNALEMLVNANVAWQLLGHGAMLWMSCNALKQRSEPSSALPVNGVCFPYPMLFPCHLLRDFLCFITVAVMFSKS